MANSWFRFKQFKIEQDSCAHKVGTDGVLLGAWIKSNKPEYILDIGSGSGVVSLILAQRFTTAHITSIELDDASHKQGRENSALSPFANRIINIHGDFLEYDFGDLRFDLIVSNPPFFKDLFLSGNTKRDRARHQVSLPHQKLISKAFQLLNPAGQIALVLPVEEAETILKYCKKYGLHLYSKTLVRNKPEKSFKRCLIQLGIKPVNPVENTLNIRDTNNSFSEDYKELTKDFYLDF